MAETIQKIVHQISNAGVEVVEIKQQDLYEDTFARAAFGAPQVPPYDWWLIYSFAPLPDYELRLLLHCVDYAVMLRLAEEVFRFMPAKSAFATMWEHIPQNWNGGDSWKRLKRFIIDIPPDPLITHNR